MALSHLSNEITHIMCQQALRVAVLLLICAFFVAIPKCYTDAAVCQVTHSHMKRTHSYAIRVTKRSACLKGAKNITMTILTTVNYCLSSDPLPVEPV